MKRSKKKIVKSSDAKKLFEKDFDKNTIHIFRKIFFNSPAMMVITDAQSGKVLEINHQFEKFYGYSRNEIIGKTLKQIKAYVNPSDRDAIASMVMKKKLGKNFEIQERVKSGKVKWVNVSVQLITISGRKCFLGSGIDITEKRQAEDKLKELSVKLEDQVVGMYDVMNNILYSLDKVVIWSRDLIEDKILYVSPGIEKMVGIPIKTYMNDPKALIDIIHPEDLELFMKYREEARRGKSLRHEFRVVLPDKSIVWIFAHLITKVENGIPIRIDGAMYDITNLKEVEQKLIDSEAQARNFAHHLNNLKEEERTQIAREIHDELGQQLTGIKYGLSSLKKADSSLSDVEAKVNSIMEDVNNAIQSLRKIITELRPGILDTLGLVPSIEWLVKEVEKKSGIKFNFEGKVKCQKFEKNLSTCFFRIAQEALNNISKHSEATRVSVLMEQTDNELLLKVSDNGIGISNEKLDNPFSMGLLSMRERASNIGGDFQLVSKENEGTTILVKANIN